MHLRDVKGRTSEKRATLPKKTHSLGGYNLRVLGAKESVDLTLGKSPPGGKGPPIILSQESEEKNPHGEISLSEGGAPVRKKKGDLNF